MLTKNKFEKLLQPFEIQGVKLKNRIVRAPCALGFSDSEGHITEADKGYFEAVAKGGTGLIVAGASYVDVPLGITDLGRFWISDDSYISGLSELTKVIHKYNCPTFLEIQHSGPSFPAHFFKGLKPVAASSLNENELPLRIPVSFYPTRGLTLEEVVDLVNKFGNAAERACKAGFDGVVVEACHSYLINSFLSRVWNKREDVYGCQNLENRARFAVEIIQTIKKRLGKNIPVGIRINGGEWGIAKGITSEESQSFAKIFEEAGADYIDVSGIGYEPDFGFGLWPEQLKFPEPARIAKSEAKKINKPGLEASRAELIKKTVGIPVIAVGRMRPELGEWLLRTGKADLIAFGRALMADPEMPNKIAEGRLDDIRWCLGCMEWMQVMPQGELMRCRVNPTFGREHEFELKPANKKKNVMVVGSGPAGMEAAVAAAKRGHAVTIYDKQRKLGGLLPLAALIKGTDVEDLPGLVRYYKTQIKKAGVQVRLGTEVDTSIIEKNKPDVIILANGSVWTEPSIKGLKNKNVLTSADLHRQVKSYLNLFGPKLIRWLTRFYLPVGKKVIIVGGLIQGFETAEFLIKRGRRVTIVESSNHLGNGIPASRFARLSNWMAKKGVRILSGVTYEEITPTGMTILTKDNKRERLLADTVLVILPSGPNTDMYRVLETNHCEVYLIGDGKEPRLIVDAIAEGARVGHLI